MSDNSFPQGFAPHSCQHAAALASNELDLSGQSRRGAETELAPTAQLSSPWQALGDRRPASSSNPSQLGMCQFWYNAGWQQGISQSYCSSCQAMSGAQALPAANPQLPLQMNPTASLAGYAAQGAWWQQQGQLLNPPESGVQSLPPPDLCWDPTAELQGPSGASSDHDHRNSAQCHCTYDKLLIEAFHSNPGKPLSMRDIHEWFKKYTHITRSKNVSAWRVGIRRNLTSCKVSCVGILYEKAAQLIATRRPGNTAS